MHVLLLYISFSLSLSFSIFSLPVPDNTPGYPVSVGSLRPRHIRNGEYRKSTSLTTTAHHLPAPAPNYFPVFFISLSLSSFLSFLTFHFSHICSRDYDHDDDIDKHDDDDERWRQQSMRLVLLLLRFFHSLFLSQFSFPLSRHFFFHPVPLYSSVSFSSSTHLPLSFILSTPGFLCSTVHFSLFFRFNFTVKPTSLDPTTDCLKYGWLPGVGIWEFAWEICYFFTIEYKKKINNERWG